MCNETSPRQSILKDAAEHGSRHDNIMSQEWPEESGSAPYLVLLYRRWTFSFMSQVLRKGARQLLPDGTHLCQDDLYKVPPSMSSSKLDNELRRIYAEKDGNLTRTLWKLAAPTFVPAGFCQLITVFAQIAIPLFVREFLRILEENPGESVTRKAMPFASLIFLAAVTNAFGNHRQRHLATKSGVILRSALVSSIYHQSLRLLPSGRAGLTSGQVTNLVAVDTQKVFEVTQEGHLIWSCPLSMVLVTILLLLILGPTALVGVVVLFSFVPAVERVVRAMIVTRKKRVAVSDERVEIINAMLQGMKVVKLNNYEARYQERIEEARNRELVYLRKELFIWALTLCLTVLTPVLASAATFATYVLVDDSNVLTVSTTFTTLLLFSALRFPINYGGRLIGKAAQAVDAIRRISEFMTRETGSDIKALQENAIDTDESNIEAGSSDVLLEVKNGMFAPGAGMTPTSVDEVERFVDEENAKDEEKMVGEGVSSHVFTLSNMNFEVSSGQILAVVGAVGSGKTTLCNAIVGEVTASPESQISCRGKLAFASQIPFILSASFRENILFGLPYEESRYEQVLDACCLRPDIEQIGGAGDLTEIGERGVTLSGGQKQRVSLARVAYSQPRIAIFDDPLSALDAGTSKMVFERLFKGYGNSLLTNSAIVLVTHASHYLHKVDNILILGNGKQGFLGSWKELNEFECEDTATRALIDNIRSAVQEGNDVVETRNENDIPDEISGGNTDPYKLNSQKAIETSGDLMTVENREHGLASRRTWFLWFKYAGGWPFVFLQIILLALDRVAYVATEWWLAQWTKAHDSPITVFGFDFPAQTDGLSAQYRYLKVYAIILLISAIATFLRSEWAVSGGARAASSLFTKMTTHVLYAPMSYFDTTPLGRVLNRFTYDVEMLDVNLTDAMSVVMIALSWFVAGLCVMCAILPWIILALVPVTTVYAMVQLHYRKSGADLQRLDAVSRSPVQAMLAEGLNGSSTIRVFQQESTFLRRFQSKADLNSSAQLNFLSAQRWIGIRIELLGTIVVLAACTVVAVFNDLLSIEPGLVALLIIWSSNFTITLGFLVDNIAEAEAAITSVERIHAMSALPQEKDMITTEDNMPHPSWPTTGALEFDNVCARYRPGLPLSLNCCSFKVPPGKRCGIVGRTGSGKSTALVALFRLVEVELGKIVLDGVDLSKLGLQDVRGRPNGMAIIPQDPVLFAGSLRQCVDPFGTSTDEAIMNALFEVHLIGSNGNHAALDQHVEEGGSNYSVGERQLLCLARAIISTPKILVMDEATASLDGQTDDLIQNMLRTRFTETTLLTVAHRLNTIMDYDFVLVMDNGRAVEFGSPVSLLEKEGAFSELVDATGEESAASLRAMAKKLP